MIAILEPFRNSIPIEIKITIYNGRPTLHHRECSWFDPGFHSRSSNSIPRSYIRNLNSPTSSTGLKASSAFFSSLKKSYQIASFMTENIETSIQIFKNASIASDPCIIHIYGQGGIFSPLMGTLSMDLCAYSWALSPVVRVKIDEMEV